MCEFDRISSKKIVIDPYRGGDDIGKTKDNLIEKDFNLEISKYIYDKLKEKNIPVSLTRNNDETLSIEDRTNKIKSLYGSGNDVIVISNALSPDEEGIQIVYALRNTKSLAEKLANSFKSKNIKVNKYYQRRLPSDTSLDYNPLIRDTKNNETLIIYYGNPNNTNDFNIINNNVSDLGDAVVEAILSYLNIASSKPTNGIYYKVKSGDTLYSIARKYNTTVDKLKAYNNLTSNNLTIGSSLKIPTSSSNTEETNSNVKTYKVVSGDSLYSIAKKYNTTVDKIKILNNLESNILSIGQILKLPNDTNTSSTKTYKVVSGDSLYSIAKKYNTTVDKIKSLNNLESNTLSIGQILKLPSNTSSTKTYKVVSGDSLYSIAKKYNTTVDKIKSLNNLTSNLLNIGDELLVP